MTKKLLRRILAWIGIVCAVAFAAFFVLMFYDFSETLNRVFGGLLWSSLALTVICFIAARFFIVLPPEEGEEPQSIEADSDDGDISDTLSDEENKDGIDDGDSSD